jgi:hypothetical protein
MFTASRTFKPNEDGQEDMARFLVENCLELVSVALGLRGLEPTTSITMFLVLGDGWSFVHTSRGDRYRL